MGSGDELDIAALRVSPERLRQLQEEAGFSPRPARKAWRRSDRHVGAPLSFVAEVCRRTEGRMVLVVALCIYRRVCVCDSRTVTLPSAELGPLGVNRSRKQAALTQLRNAGLVGVKNTPGHTTKVTLLWRPDRPL